MSDDTILDNSFVDHHRFDYYEPMTIKMMRH
jgi:hypothetical protein